MRTLTTGLFFLLTACGQEPLEPRGAMPEACSTTLVQALSAVDGSFWTEREINVCWTGESIPLADAIAGNWSNHIDVRFVYWGPCDGQPADAHRISIDTSLEQRPRSKIGTHSRDHLPSMYIPANACPADNLACWRHLIVHEFGHALGFGHEHLRTDAPEETDACGDGGAAPTFDITTYDADSIMNYCSKTTFLSCGDIIGAQSVYGAAR